MTDKARHIERIRAAWIAWLVAIHLLATVNTIAHWNCWHHGSCNRRLVSEGSGDSARRLGLINQPDTAFLAKFLPARKEVSR